MKITALIAAAALATVSTAAVADTTTPAGELVIVEKNQSTALTSTQIAALAVTAGFVAVVSIVAANSDT